MYSPHSYISKKHGHQKVTNSEYNTGFYQDGAETFQLHIALQGHSLAATMDDWEKPLLSLSSHNVTHNKLHTHYKVYVPSSIITGAHMRSWNEVLKYVSFFLFSMENNYYLYIMILTMCNAYVCCHLVGVVESNHNTFSCSISTTCSSSVVLRAPSACENVNSLIP